MKSNNSDDAADPRSSYLKQKLEEMKARQKYEESSSRANEISTRRNAPKPSQDGRGYSTGSDSAKCDVCKEVRTGRRFEFVAPIHTEFSYDVEEFYNKTVATSTWKFKDPEPHSIFVCLSCLQQDRDRNLRLSRLFRLAMISFVALAASVLILVLNPSLNKSSPTAFIALLLLLPISGIATIVYLWKALRFRSLLPWKLASSVVVNRMRRKGISVRSWFDDNPLTVKNSRIIMSRARWNRMK